MTREWKTVQTPVGPLCLIAGIKGVQTVAWHNQAPDMTGAVENRDNKILHLAADELATYFAGRLKIFSVPLDPQGTDFQQEVWRALRAIPYGQTRSYAQQAAAIGRPKAVRAVGAANGRNPLSIIVPCHRVIGSNGKLTGFAGGLEVKERLIELEGSLAS